MKHLPPSPSELNGQDLPTKINNREPVSYQNSNLINQSKTQIISEKFKNKIITGILLIAILPIITLGATSYIKNQLIEQSIESRIDLTESGEIAYEIIYKQSLWLVLATGTIAGIAGTIAFILADRLIEPILKSANITAKLVDRLYSKENVPESLTKEDELGNLVNNLHLIEHKLPDLLWKQEAKQANFQKILEVIYTLQKSRSVEELFKNTVAETRRVLRADRVTIMQIGAGNRGVFVEEAVAPRLPEIIGTAIEDLTSELDYLEDYQRDYVRVINNIYKADLSPRYLTLLENFGVKANIIAPIKCNQGKKLLGLLIAHQCNNFRNWQSQEIELITYVAQQVGFSLEHTQVLEKTDAKIEQDRKFIKLAYQIRKTLNKTEILNTTVRELRQEINADRVVVYSFNPDWSGYISAESVLPGLPHAKNRKIKDPCIPQRLIQAYKEGRILPNNNVFEADLHPDHLQLMKQLDIKANLIAPILKGGQLFGLLIAHQCSAPRQWQQAEIGLFSQIATQVGFALDHARLLAKVEAEKEKNQLLEKITQYVSTSLNFETIFAYGVEEVRKFLQCDRVIIYSIDTKRKGTVIAESVVPNVLSMLDTEIDDPCFKENFIEKYQAGRINIADDIYEAGLSQCYIKELERFEVKANLVAPILQDNKLLGLLIAHQCSTPRYWQDWEIRLFTQVAQQISFALDRAKLVKQLEAESRQNKLIADISRSIRSSLVEENVLNTAVTEVRKVLECDRVMVYNFDPDWYGTVVAESVVPGFPKALWREIKDPCFIEGYVEKYQTGRIQVVDDIYQAGLTECHLGQLEPFKIKSNLVAPILKDSKLMGLLIANHCTAPHHWQEWEINFFSRIADRVSFAIDHCRILNQSEQSYHQVKTDVRQQKQAREKTLTQILAILDRSEKIAIKLSQQNLDKQTSIDSIAERLKTITAEVTKLQAMAIQAQQKEQQWLQSFSEGQEIWDRAIDEEKGAHLNTIEINTKTRHLISSSQELLQITNTLDEHLTQLKLEGMNGVLEAARNAETNPKFASVSQKIHNLAQQIDREIVQIQPLASTIQDNVREIDSILKIEENKIQKAASLKQQTQQKIQEVDTNKQQIETIFSDLTQIATEQAQALKRVGQSLTTIAEVNHPETIEKSKKIITSLNKLKTEVKELNTSP